MCALRNRVKTEHTLEDVVLLAELPERDLRTLEACCRWRRYLQREQIIDCESDTHEVFFLVEGRVRVVNYSASGREISYADVEAGGCFGELAAIDNGPRSASVVALDDTLVASLAPHLFLDSISNHPALAIGFLLHLVHMLRQADQRILELSSLSAHNRVQAELLRLARATRRGNDTAIISPIPIHADIASRVSTTRETVGRVLSGLTRKGLVRRKRDALVIRNVRQLTEMVEEFKAE